MRSKTMLEVSRTSIKKADQDLENICFYSLGWPNEKQSTQTRLPKSTCIKKAPFTIIHQMNEVKNHVGCLSRSIKKADQDIEMTVFIVLAGQMRNSQHWRGYQQAPA